MKLKKDDNVKILTGKDKGKTGKVIAVFPHENRLTVEGANMFSKRARPRKQGQKGEIVRISRPLQASNVMLLCPNCKKPARLGVRVEGNKKLRICVRCKATV